VQEHYEYFEWIDPPTCVRGTKIAAKIIEKSSKLEKSVLIAHEREVVARGIEARAREKENDGSKQRENVYACFSCVMVLNCCVTCVFLVHWSSW
jgi:hypothetical protein